MLAGLVLAVLGVLAAAPASAAPAPALAAGGSGDFHKTADCRPFATGPLGKVSNYDKGTGQELHYSTQSVVTWSAYRVYLSINDGAWIQLTPASEGYAYVSNKGAKLETKHVWRAWSGLTDSCINVT
jgi:hypothetical protein